MSLGIRGRLFAMCLALVLPVLALAHLGLSGAVDAFLVAQIRTDLEVRAHLVARQVTRNAPDALPDWDAVTQEVAAAAHARVTLLAPDGTVLGDSEQRPDQRARMENHAGRPEVVAALSTGSGSSVRRSSTLGQRMMYLAIPLVLPQGRGVLRLAMPLHDVDKLLLPMRRSLGLVALLALVAALVTALAVASWMARRTRQLTEMAGRMADGDLEARARSVGSREFAELGGALNRLAEGLSRSMQDVKAERDLLGEILAGMQEGVLLVDAHDRAVVINPALREMLLLGTNSAGKPATDVVRLAEFAHLVAAARNGNGPASNELELPGLKPRRVLVRAVPLRGRPQTVLSVFVDVTNLRRLEHMRKDFVANASHELRTPVASIRAAAEMLGGAMVADAEAAGRFVAIIERNAERLQHLVSDLLDLSRIESNQFRMQLEPIEVAAAVEQTLATFRPRADAKSMVLQQDLAPDLPLVSADRQGLEQVLTNLVDNATQYCPDGTTVTISGAVAAGQIVLGVSDDGPGIEAKHLPRLFERFYRVDKGRSRDVGGTGLGLSIVKNLVEAMGGVVDVRSKVAKGTHFSVSLPIAEDLENTAPEVQAAPAL